MATILKRGMTEIALLWHPLFSARSRLFPIQRGKITGVYHQWGRGDGVVVQNLSFLVPCLLSPLRLLSVSSLSLLLGIYICLIYDVET